MTSYTWANAQTGTWNTLADWTPNGTPGAGSGDTATIDGTGSVYKVTYNEPSATLNALTVNSASVTLQFSGGDTLTVSGTTNLEAGTVDLESSGATLNAGSLNEASSGTINLASGGVLNFTSATLDGFVTTTGTENFGSSSAAIAMNGGILEATNGTTTVNFAAISGSGEMVAAGGTLIAASSLANSQVVAAISNSSLSVFEATGSLYYGSSISVEFFGSSGEFEYNNTTATSNITFKVAGLNAGASATSPTNFIDLAGQSTTISSGGSGTAATGTVLLSNGDTLSLSGITGYGVAGWRANAISDGHGGTEIFLSTVCYAAGTRILTPDGNRTVESLRPGDQVLTVKGEALEPMPVKWIGRRRIDIRTHPRPESVAPIRILRDAICDNVPHTDLSVSPDHAVLIDGKLICARQLVNDVSILRDSASQNVEYFHVELDIHAILLAEGLTAESYLDTGNRGFFANADAPLTLHPDLTDEADHPTRAMASCHPFASDEATVGPIWRRIAERAGFSGPHLNAAATTVDPAPCLIARGKTIRPTSSTGGVFTFVLPRGLRDVRIVSRAAAPADTRPWRDDRRRLGLHVERIVLRGGRSVHEIALDHPALSLGWWEIERDGTALCRWTNGDAVLPLPATQDFTILELRAGHGDMAYATSEAQRHAA